MKNLIKDTRSYLALLGLSFAVFCPSNAANGLDANRFYVKAGIGGIKHLKFKDTSLVGIRKAPQGTLVYKIGAGYKYNKFIRTDITYQYAGLKYKAESFKQTIHTNSAFLNVYFDLSYFNHFVPYLTGGIGVGHNVAGYLSGPMGVSEKGKSRTNFIWNIGAGARYDFTKHYAIDLEYRLMNLGKIHTKQTTFMTEVLAPTNQTIRGNQFIASIVYTF